MVQELANQHLQNSNCEAADQLTIGTRGQFSHYRRPHSSSVVTVDSDVMRSISLSDLAEKMAQKDPTLPAENTSYKATVISFFIYSKLILELPQALNSSSYRRVGSDPFAPSFQPGQTMKWSA